MMILPNLMKIFLGLSVIASFTLAEEIKISNDFMQYIDGIKKENKKEITKEEKQNNIEKKVKIEEKNTKSLTKQPIEMSEKEIKSGKNITKKLEELKTQETLTPNQNTTNNNFKENKKYTTTKEFDGLTGQKIDDNIKITVENIEEKIKNDKEEISIIKTIRKLVEDRKYSSALDVFTNTPDIKANLSTVEYESYLSFLKLVNNFSNKDIKIENIKYILPSLIERLFNEFYMMLTEGKINDTDYVVKMISMIEQSQLSRDDKFRNKMKINFLTGKSVLALKNGLSIENKNKMDIDFIANILNVVEVLEQEYFTNTLQTTHKEWSIMNMNKGKK